MAEKRKFYVVWEGRDPGVYDNWEDCLAQVDGFPGAKYKSFKSQQEAVEAFRGTGEEEETGLTSPGLQTKDSPRLPIPPQAPRQTSPRPRDLIIPSSQKLTCRRLPSTAHAPGIQA